MGAPAVLTEKLRRPDAAGLRRARLERPLLHLGPRLGLVVAPPGSGKTTLLAGVAAAAQTPVAWYRVTADDGDEGSLVAHLRRAVQDALGIPPRDPGDADDRMSDLLETLEQWTSGTPTAALVILDDLHEIAGSAAEEAVERFVALRPHAIGVVIGSRRHPGMNIPRLRVSGELHEISSDDLRFRSWEVEELFMGVFHEPLSPESAAALTRRTGGWAAGLQLFHLATAGRSVAERHRAVDDLGGRSKLIRSYLARNVLSELPEGRRQFLLRTCTLGSMTGPLCDALLETTGSAIVLDELEQQQLFTSSDDDGTTFRYHEVLRTHLEWALIQEYGPDGARSWYARSAALLEQIGDRRGALRAYARAEDWAAVARLIQAGTAEPVGVDAGADVLAARVGRAVGPLAVAGPGAAAGPRGVAHRRGQRLPAGGGAPRRAGVSRELSRGAGSRPAVGGCEPGARLVDRARRARPALVGPPPRGASPCTRRTGRRPVVPGLPRRRALRPVGDRPHCAAHRGRPRGATGAGPGGGGRSGGPGDPAAWRRSPAPWRP